MSMCKACGGHDNHHVPYIVDKAIEWIPEEVLSALEKAGCSFCTQDQDLSDEWTKYRVNQNVTFLVFALAQVLSAQLYLRYQRAAEDRAAALTAWYLTSPGLSERARYRKTILTDMKVTIEQGIYEQLLQLRVGVYVPSHTPPDMQNLYEELVKIRQTFQGNHPCYTKTPFERPIASAP